MATGRKLQAPKEGEQPPALLMAAVNGVAQVASECIHLFEKKVVACPDRVWVLDTGASNHVTGDRSALINIDNNVQGTMRFGDDSCVEIQGLGSVVIQGRPQEHKVLTDVYYISKLKSNIVSLSQLEELGCEISMKNGKMSVFDLEGTLLISAPRTMNRLYTVKLGVVNPVCFLMKQSDEAWRWHARFGDLNFRAQIFGQERDGGRDACSGSRGTGV